jgi:hypothetical protein
MGAPSVMSPDGVQDSRQSTLCDESVVVAECQSLTRCGRLDVKIAVACMLCSAV